MRRWWKTPESKIARYKHLLKTTDYAADKCRQLAGLTRSVKASEIAHEERRYISKWRWIVKSTGEIRPVVPPCTYACAARKTGMSMRTIRRRVDVGLLEAKTTKAHGSIRLFDPEELLMVKDIGLNPPDFHAKLTRDDVDTIRRRAAAGETHASIAQDYPVSRRQIGRIVDGTRWRI